MKNTMLRLGIVLLAFAALAAFPLAQMGYAPLHRLLWLLILPSGGLLAGFAAVPGLLPSADLRRALRTGLLGGALATLALELVRYSGFRLGFMPGNLPELMGVLLLDRFALGPSPLSTAAGFAYHFWNGAAFGAAFTMLPLARPGRWAAPYGLAIGVGFLASPVVDSLGVGAFGKDFGWSFAATVLIAHLAYGMALGYWLTHRRRARSSGRSTSNHAGPASTVSPARRDPVTASSKAELVDQ